MKGEKKKVLLIYTLIFIIIILIVALTKIVIDSYPKQKQESTGHIEKLNINQYPTVNKECTFDVTSAEYSALSMAGCKGGYTRYNIKDIVLNEKTLKVSVIFSDKKQVKTGIFINDKRVTQKMENITNVNFGVFGNTLIIFDKNGNEANVLAFNSKGKEIYNLKDYLKNNKTKELVTGDTNISSKTLDPNSFSFKEGIIEFNSVANTCQKGETSKGSHYKITYSNETFQKPEFMNLVSCN